MRRHAVDSRTHNPRVQPRHHQHRDAGRRSAPAAARRGTTFVRVAEVAAEPGAPVVVPPAAGEVRIVGVPATAARQPRGSRKWLRRRTRSRSRRFSLADLEQLAARERVTLRALLEELRAAGLELVAEAPFDRLQDRAPLDRGSQHRRPRARAADDPSAAVRRGSPTLLNAVSSCSSDVAVIRAFAPLPRRVNPAVPTTGYDDVKRVALARLFVDNIPSIQVDWSLYGPKLAQVALTVGADDVDARVGRRTTPARGRRRAPLEEIRRNIRAAGLEPVERNGRFERRVRNRR